MPSRMPRRRFLQSAAASSVLLGGLDRLLPPVRADEAKHREVNHTLGNLNQGADPNPYTAKYKDPSKAHPSKGIDKLKPTGWEREEVI